MDEPEAAIREQEVEAFWNCNSAEKKIEFLCAWTNVYHYERNPRSKFWVDFCFHLLHFAKEDATMSNECAVHLVSCLKPVYEHATQDPWPSLEENYDLFAKSLKHYSTERQAFSVDQVQAIVTYMVQTFFSQYRLFQYVHKNKPSSRMTEIDLLIEAPLEPLPLAQAELQLEPVDHEKSSPVVDSEQVVEQTRSAQLVESHD